MSRGCSIIHAKTALGSNEGDKNSIPTHWLFLGAQFPQIFLSE
jgi:hypothetical protein